MSTFLYVVFLVNKCVLATLIFICFVLFYHLVIPFEKLVLIAVVFIFSKFGTVFNIRLFLNAYRTFRGLMYYDDLTVILFINTFLIEFYSLKPHRFIFIVYIV